MKQKSFYRAFNILYETIKDGIYIFQKEELYRVLFQDVYLLVNDDLYDNDSIRKIEEYLISLGFVNNGNGEYSKDGLYVAPKDSQLDLVIYVWKD